MAHRYLNSACTGATDPYTTPATAATSLAQLLSTGTAIDSATDIIYVIDTHSEPSVTSGVALSVTSPATAPTAPQRLLCVTDLSDPTTLSTGAYFAIDEAYSVRLVGSWYFYGCTFHANHTNNNCLFSICYGSTGPYVQYFDSCLFRSRPSGSQTSSVFQILSSTNSANDPSLVRLINCYLHSDYGTLASMLRVDGNGIVEIENLSWSGSSTYAAAAIGFWNDSQARVTLANSDLSSVALPYLYYVVGFSLVEFTVRNVKLPSGCLPFNSASVGFGTTHRFINVDSGDTYTKYSERDGRLGEWAIQTSIYASTSSADLTAAAGDSFSIQMTTTAYVSRFLPRYSQWMHVWNDGTSYTPSVEVLVGGDGASALNTDELWLEVAYNSGTDSPLGTSITTLPGIISSVSAVPAGTTSWTGDGYTTERTHKLSSSSFTPDKPGWVYMRVALAKPSTTIYVNPPR